MRTHIRRRIALIIVVVFIIYVIIILLMYGSNTTRLQDSNLNLNFEVSISCVQKICLDNNGVVECILLNNPMLLKQNVFRDLNHGPGNIYEITYSIINNRCE